MSIFIPRVVCRRHARWQRPLRGAALAVMLVAGSGSLVPGSAGAQSDCGTPAQLNPGNVQASPRHHPVGRPLPDTAAYRQPDDCEAGVWFYDENGNRHPDPSEAQLYGSTRLIACGSCHADSGEPTSVAAQVLFLRQDASRLCLVCHNL